MSIRQQVTDFHHMIGAPVHATPQVPPEDRVRLRLRLAGEEFLELVEAALDHSTCPDAWLRLRTGLYDVIDRSAVSVDLPDFADACADLDYVVEGSRLECGITGEPIANAVHAANMTKADGPVDEYGKKRKPPGWQPPDVAGELRKQGWQP